MRVIYISPVADFEGRNAASVRLKNILPKIDKESDLLVFAFSNSSEEKNNILVKNIKYVPKAKRGMLGRISDFLDSRPGVFKTFDNPEAVRALKKAVETFKPDVIHYDTFATIGLYRYFEHIDAVFHIHDAQSKKYDGWIATAAPARKSYLKSQKPKVKQIEKSILPKGKVVIVDSAADAELLRRETGANAQVIPLGYDSEEYSLNGNKENLNNPSLVFSGSMSSLQTLDAVQFFVDDVFPLIQKEVPNVTLYLVGSSPHTKILEAGKKDGIFVTGFVDKLSDYLRGATVYVCPLRIGSGMRTRIVEALGAGCAMVTTSEGVTGLAKFEEDVWLETDDAQVFANYAVMLLNDSEKREAFKLAAYNYAKSKYSWGSMADKILNIYSGMSKTVDKS